MPTIEPALIVALVVVLLAVIVLDQRIVPAARNVERLGRYHRTLNPGLNVVILFVDRVYPAIDLREQVVFFPPQPVITEDNLVVEIDTVLYFRHRPALGRLRNRQLPAGRRAAHGHHPAQRGGRWTWRMTLTSRDEINSRLRGVPTRPRANGGCG